MIKSRLSLIAMLLIFIFSLGKSLDWEAERVVEQLYSRDKHGVIKGLSGFFFQKQKPEAIIFIHGFLDSPEVFKDYFNNQKLRQIFDIAVPRLRFHAKNLQSAHDFNNEKIEKGLLDAIQAISQKHQHITIVAHSYAGALTLKLLHQHQLPQNTTIILLAPSFFIKENDFFGNFKLYSYGLWRNYCNYSQLGCIFPGYGSGDENARAYLAKAVNLRYLVAPALKQLFHFDRQNHSLIISTKQDFKIIIAKDDNRVDYAKIKDACTQNSACHLYTYPSGKHLLPQSQFKQELLNQIVDIRQREKNAITQYGRGGVRLSTEPKLQHKSQYPWHVDSGSMV